MDFQQNTQPEIQNEQGSIPNQQMPEIPAPQQNIEPASAPAGPSSEPKAHTDNAQPGNHDAYGGNNDSYGSNPYNHNPYENGARYQNGAPGQNPQPYNNGNSGNSPYQVKPPYGEGGSAPYQNNIPYENRNPYQNNAPYRSHGYYFDRAAYQMPYAEPGSNLANAAMVLGIISIIVSFTFTLYPAFIAGSIAILLGLLSKGTRAKLLNKARTGIICAAVGLIINTAITASCMTLLFTNSEFREEVNRTCEEQYGMSFDEMLDEILENSGFR